MIGGGGGSRFARPINLKDKCHMCDAKMRILSYSKQGCNTTHKAVRLEEETPEKRQEIAGQSMHTSTKMCMFTILDISFIFMLPLPFFANI